MHRTTGRRRRVSLSARRSFLLLAGFLALVGAASGCSSTETARTTMTGVWAGRMAYVTPRDSFAFYLEQRGAAVQGWGIFYSGTGAGAGTRFVGNGVIAGGELTMKLTDVRGNSGVRKDSVVRRNSGSGAARYYLSGRVGRSPMNARFAAGGRSYRIALRPARPTTSDVAGTWVLAKTTGAAAPAGLLDTIVASTDGRAYRHREGDYAFALQSIWSRHGDYMVLDNSGDILPKDSLLVASAELQRTEVVSGGETRTEHYTRVPASAELP